MRIKGDGDTFVELRAEQSIQDEQGLKMLGSLSYCSRLSKKQLYAPLTPFSLPQLRDIFGLCCSPLPFFVTGLFLLPCQGMERETRVLQPGLWLCEAALTSVVI